MTRSSVIKEHTAISQDLGKCQQDAGTSAGTNREEWKKGWNKKLRKEGLCYIVSGFAPHPQLLL